VIPELPHWSEPPTGQVPAVIDRHGDDADSGWVRDTGPSWREHAHEWEDPGFEPLLSDPHLRMGALEETPLEERQPWEFSDEPVAAEEATIVIEVVEGAEARLVPEPPEAGVGGAPGAPGSSSSSEPVPGAADDPWALARRRPEPDRPETPVASGAPTGEHGQAGRNGREAADDLGPAGDEEPPTQRVAVSSGLHSPSAAGAGPVPPTRPALRRSAVGLAEPPPPAHTNGGGPRPRPGGVAASGDGGAAGRNVPVAIVTGLVFAAVAALALKAGTVASLVLVTVVVTLAAAECFAALRRAGRRPATLLGLVATVALMVTAYSKGVAAIPLVLALVVVASMVWYLTGVERTSPVEGISSTVFGFAWVGLMGSFAALLLAPSIFPDRHGIAFLFGAVVAVVGCDVGALIVGGWIGRHPLAPRVSPNKTWEGFFGGAVLAVVASAAITGQMHPWTPGKAALLGVVAAVLAPVGDLAESLVKRDLGVKDLGTLLPGHGGVLDRFDGLLFVLPATYYLVKLLNLG
jgi:CDP-diglyceride synthetase